MFSCSGSGLHPCREDSPSTSTPTTRLPTRSYVNGHFCMLPPPEPATSWSCPGPGTPAHCFPTAAREHDGWSPALSSAPCPEGRFMFWIMGATLQFERELIAERTCAALTVRD